NSIDPADPYGSRPLKKLRLWKKPGHEPRNPNSVGHLTDPGDFVAQSLIIPIADLGYTPGSGPIVLYLEGLDPNALGVNEQISVFTSFTTGVPNIATCFREEYVRVAVFKVDLDMDSDRNGVVEDTIEDDRREHLWDYGKTDLTATPPDYKTGAIIRVNNDDDDGDSIPDSETFVMDTPIDANDMSELWIRQLNLATLPLGWSVWLKLDDHQEYMNVHAPFPYGTILGMVEGKDEFELLATDILGSGSLVVPVEATRYPGYPDSNFDGLITLRLIVRNGPLATDSVVAEDVIQMRVAPWMMPSHLDSVMDVYVTDTFPARPASSVNGVTIAAAPSFVDRLTDALGAAGPAPIVINSGDPWPQDQYEFGYHSAPDGVWDIVLLNSPRRYGIGSPPQYPLEAYATSTIFSSDYGIYGINPPGVSYTEWPTAGGFSTRDSFGNLEAFPPKGKWTSGHVYHSSSMKIELLEFLDGQSSQNKSPDTIFDTSWLLVGHVDEFMTIQQTGPEAFRVILANTALGVYLLNQIASNDPALEFNEGQLWEDDVLRTATSLLGNLLVSDPSKDLEDYNMLIQTNYLDALKMQLQNDPTITEIIEVPGFFHEFTGPGFTPTFPNINSAASAFPDMVNLLYVDGRMIVPDPMVDEFKAVFEALVDPSPAWIDCLEYHWSIGEVHCGTNVLRAPRPEVLEWWLVDPAP
ncbi:MAG: protein-arginine deiminase family protein, partial [Planctomycetota bacterium]|nr:protein-arginine deiminase family protein [Planctomycetota bacterium]